jgi:uncharacterized protein YbjT (DUF2867 family)
MRLFILGATGHTGRQLTDLALKKGHSVTVFVRSPQKLAANGAGLRVVEGSPADIERMAEAMQGHEAVFSTLGPKPGEVFTSLSKRSWTMEKFAANTSLAMDRAKVRRLVVFSSAGLFPDQNIFVRFLSALARHHMADLRHMEKVVVESPLDWTIVRPVWMGPGEDERYRAEVGALPAGAMKLSFRALAKCMLETVEGGLYPRQIVGLGR